MAFPLRRAAFESLTDQHQPRQQSVHPRTVPPASEHSREGAQRLLVHVAGRITRPTWGYDGPNLRLHRS